MRLAAKIISVVFHPLLMATYLFGMFKFFMPGAYAPLREEGHNHFLLIIFCVTFVLPAINLYIFKLFGSVKSLAMEERSDRIVPFTFTAILYCAITYLFYARTPIGLGDNILRFLIIVDALVVVGTVATYFYKVSIHSLGVWGIIGVLLPLNRLIDTGALYYPTIVCILVAGVVMSARLSLNAHSPRQVMMGSVLGLATSVICMFLLF